MNLVSENMDAQILGGLLSPCSVTSSKACRHRAGTVPDTKEEGTGFFLLSWRYRLALETHCLKLLVSGLPPNWVPAVFPGIGS